LLFNYQLAHFNTQAQLTVEALDGE